MKCLKKLSLLFLLFAICIFLLIPLNKCFAQENYKLILRSKFFLILFFAVSKFLIFFSAYLICFLAAFLSVFAV